MPFWAGGEGSGGTSGTGMGRMNYIRILSYIGINIVGYDFFFGKAELPRREESRIIWIVVEVIGIGHEY